MFDVSILIIFYNRSSAVTKVLQKVKKINPQNIYLFCDGPKDEKDFQLVDTARKSVDKFLFSKNCKVKKKYLTQNKGLRNGVISAIDWFFSQEENGIILEDDCVPSKSFFYYCKENLLYHKNNTQVMSIGGLNLVEQLYNKNFCPNSYSYFFTKSPMIWGWATWKNRWKKFDKSMQSWNSIYKSTKKRKIYFPDHYSNQFYPERIQSVKEGKDQSWAYTWDYTLRINHGLNITPKKNLVKNIGFGKQQTHNTPSYKALCNLKVGNLRINKHNKIFINNPEFDSLLAKFFSNKTFLEYIRSFLRTLLINRFFNIKKLIKL